MMRRPQSASPIKHTVTIYRNGERITKHCEDKWFVWLSRHHWIQCTRTMALACSSINANCHQCLLFSQGVQVPVQWSPVTTSHMKTGNAIIFHGFTQFLQTYFRTVLQTRGYATAQLVEALRLKPEGHDEEKRSCLLLHCPVQRRILQGANPL